MARKKKSADPAPIPDNPSLQTVGAFAAKTVKGDRAAFRAAMGGAKIPRGDEEPSTESRDTRREEAPRLGSEASEDEGPFVAKRDEEPEEVDEGRPDDGETDDDDEPAQRDADDDTAADDDEPEAGDTPGEDEEYDRAADALHRSGFNWKEIRSMGRQQALKRGLRAAARLEADDEAHEFMRRSGPTKTGTDGKAGSNGAPAPAPKVKLAELLKPFAERAAIDEEALAALADPLQKVFDGQQTLIDSLSQNESRREAAEEERLLVSTRKGLVGRFPELAREPKYRDVLDQLEVMIGGKKYRTIKAREGTEAAVRSAMEDAAVAVGLRKDARNEDDLARRTDRRSGREDRTHSRSTLPVTRGRPRMTSRDKDLTIFRHVTAHPGDVQGARRAAGIR